MLLNPATLGSVSPEVLAEIETQSLWSDNGRYDSQCTITYVI